MDEHVGRKDSDQYADNHRAHRNCCKQGNIDQEFLGDELIRIREWGKRIAIEDDHCHAAENKHACQSDDE